MKQLAGLEDGAHGVSARPSPHAHIVQFYEDDRVLVESIARFVITGVRCLQPIVIIACARRRAALAAQLRREDLDVDGITGAGQLVMVDAEDTLARFMDGAAPDADRFRQVVGALLAGSADRREVCVRAYGEMVDVLWQRGARGAALQLEQLWNDLARSYTFSLLCAYSMGNFLRSGDREALEAVCRAHGHVLPAEAYANLDAEDRGHQLAVLDQRARALDAEVAHRQALEVELAAARAREADAVALGARYHALLAGLLGHDLRNPLGAVLMNADCVARLNLGDSVSRSASRIASCAVRMSRMIDQLLDFTRIWIGGGVVIDPVALDLAVLCRQHKDELEADHPAWCVLVELIGDTTGVWDANGITHVLATLARNAITHGTGACQIALRVDGSAAGEVAVEVHNGGAMPRALAASRFEPAWADKPRHKADGLGLGLFISRHIVVAHGGSIAVSSNERHGTTLRVTLPRTATAS